MDSPEHYLGNGVTINLHYLADDLADDLTTDALMDFIQRIAKRRSLQFRDELMLSLNVDLLQDIGDNVHLLRGY